MKAPVLVVIPWADEQLMTDALVDKVMRECEARDLDYHSTAHWTVESMTVARDHLVVCLAFFGVQ
jgi:hypothetical protein